MANYQIITDSACDLPRAMLQQLDVQTVALHVLFKGVNMEDSVDVGLKEIYAGLREGEKTSTSAVNPEGWADAIRPALENGQDALVLAFSSGLSTTYQSAVIAAEELMEAFPGRTVRVVDTLCAALGQGLLVWYACKQRDAGLSLEELTAWYRRSGLPLKRFFNTSGKLYSELALKDKLPAMSEAEQLALLASNGMLVKRPLVVKGNVVLTGFKEAEWEKLL